MKLDKQEQIMPIKEWIREIQKSSQQKLTAHLQGGTRRKI